MDYASYASSGGTPEWFSDPNITFSNPPAPYASSSLPARPSVTSLGFDAPPQPLPTLGGLRQPSRLGFSTYEGEPALLQELGIDFGTILEKTKSALWPAKALDGRLMADGDIAGPFVFCLMLGVALALVGKLHFGYVFGFGVVGCVAMYAVLNLMTQRENGVELHVVFSVLGYSLLPIVFLAFVAVVVPLKGNVGLVLVPPSVGWCTLTATRFFEAALSAREQRYLIAYPAFLLFACFALITVF